MSDKQGPANQQSGFPELGRADLDLESLRQYTLEAVDWMFDYLQSPGGEPIYPTERSADIFSKFDESLPLEGQPPSEVLSEFKERVVPLCTDLQHPGNLAYIPNSTGVVGIVADLLASTLNQNVSLVRGGPSAAAIEQQVVGWLAALIGFTGGGVLTSGGSMANLMALGLARELRGEGAQSVFYLSEETHSSMDRALRFLGFRGDSVRHVAVDQDFRMHVGQLAELISRDRGLGRTPTCVVATAGTISSGAIDPLPELSELCRAERLWLHIDGAYGALAAAAPSHYWLREQLAGADSLSMDPHKWLFVPIDTSCLLVRDVEAMRRFFTVVPEYLKVTGNENVYQPMEHTLELSRRFRGLRLWMVLKSYGLEAIRKRIEDHLDLSRQLGQWIAASEDFELSVPVATSTVCFRHLPGENEGRPLSEERLDELNEAIFHEINKCRGIYVSRNRLGGRFTLRVCITHLRTTQADIVRFWESCQEVSRRLARG